MAYHGSLHIVRYGNSSLGTAEAYDVMFGRYLGGGSMKARRFVGVDPLARFLEHDMGIVREVIDEVAFRLHTEGHATIPNLDTPDGDLRRFGLSD